jgi:spore cortex formation protein SpoVR/YcgB (stage V sporulation)
VKINEAIVLTIFGGERCVVMLENLEAAANVIHKKAVRESETSANPSTLGVEIERQISPINAESGPSETEIPRP